MARAAKRQRQKSQRRARIEEEIKEYKAKRRRKLSINIGILAAVAGAIAFVALRAGNEEPPAASPTPTPEATPTATAVACDGETPPPAEPKSYTEPPAMSIDPSKTYTARIETSCGEVVIQLATDRAPQTVNSFVFLAREGFFDGLTFHRVVKGFAIQGGDPSGDGTGGSGYKVEEAPPSDLQYVKGTVAMAKGGGEPAGTSGSQFFIVPGDGASTLPVEYALLGTVVTGFEVLDRIVEVPTVPGPSGEQSTPTQTIYIVKVTIEES